MCSSTGDRVYLQKRSVYLKNVSPECLNSHFFSYCQNERRHTALSAHYPQGLVSPVFLDETWDVCEDVCAHVCICLSALVRVSATVMTFTPCGALIKTFSFPQTSSGIAIG